MKKQFARQSDERIAAEVHAGRDDGPPSDVLEAALRRIVAYFQNGAESVLDYEAIMAEANAALAAARPALEAAANRLCHDCAPDDPKCYCAARAAVIAALAKDTR